MSNGQMTANSMNQIDAEISLPILSKDKVDWNPQSGTKARSKNLRRRHRTSLHSR